LSVDFSFEVERTIPIIKKDFFLSETEEVSLVSGEARFFLGFYAGRRLFSLLPRMERKKHFLLPFFLGIVAGGKEEEEKPVFGRRSLPSFAKNLRGGPPYHGRELSTPRVRNSASPISS